MAEAKRTCSFDHCEDRVLAKGLCSAHYDQRRRGEPLRPKRVIGTVEERIESRIIRTDSCWEWSGARANTGYGQIRIDGKLHYAHRLMYERERGPLVAGMEIDHSCHNRGCVNPAHLEQVTHRQNGENRTGPTTVGTSGYRGVTRDRRSGKWRAQAGQLGRNHIFGLFDTPEAAAEAASAGRARLFTNSRQDDPNEPIDDLDDDDTVRSVN